MTGSMETLTNSTSQYMSKTDQFMARTDATLQNQASILQNQGASIRNLEVQMEQLANALSAREKDGLLSQMEVNPKGKDHCYAITLQNGNLVKTIVDLDAEKVLAVELDWPDSSLPAPPVKAYVPPIQFPQRLRSAKKDNQFFKFLEVFKKLQANIPFAKALEQMPSYAKFMKEILSKKRRVKDFESIQLTEECSAIVQQKLPIKHKDPGSFTIPCTIGSTLIEQTLCDLGASINLMPLSIAKHIGLDEISPTTMSLPMADRSIKYPLGIMENI
ncbi:uncharacterized protein LOC119992746 [Tripterygium wilfordii]|uniref:uncharacterized protein LOC119992746 n=1 Tax=Tripterygium wilfordii TaxID=458696 RepID=UPI0018F822C5|nr:uncharacterized protein LOC119992746 [Tripterygium wilfordii]